MSIGSSLEHVMLSQTFLKENGWLGRDRLANKEQVKKAKSGRPLFSFRGQKSAMPMP